MELSKYRNKTTYFGVFLVLVAVGKSIVPEYFEWIDQAPSTLTMVGFGLVVGRDAIRKLTPN